MATIYDIDPNELIEEAAKELQKVDSVKPPEWAVFIKTGHFKQRPPARDDWWYVRAAAVLRKVYRKGPIGVSKLRTMYGGRKNNGVAGEHSYKGSGSVVRKVLQQLEKAEFLRQGKVGIRKGRIITPKGKKFLDGIATKLKGSGKEVKVEAKPADKPKELSNESEKLSKKGLQDSKNLEKGFRNKVSKPSGSPETSKSLEMSEKQGFSEHAQKSSISDKSKTSQKAKPKAKAEGKPAEAKPKELSNESEKGLEKSKTSQKAPKAEAKAEKKPAEAPKAEEKPEQKNG